MGTRNAAGSIDADGPDLDAPDTVFQIVVAAYGGTLLAGSAATIGTVLGVAPTGFAGVSAGGFLAGCLVGIGLARVDTALPVRIGRTLGRRLTTLLPAFLFATVVVLSWVVTLEPFVDAVALGSAIAVAVAGYALSQTAQNRYVDAATGDAPAETWDWEPPSAPLLDGALLVVYLFLAAGGALGGQWWRALLWLAIAVLWAASSLLEGRWPFGPWRSRCEIRLYEGGLVKRRPYTKALVSWDEVDHVRLRDGELVLDRGLLDVRFDRGELADPDAVLEAIDRRVTALPS